MKLRIATLENLIDCSTTIQSIVLLFICFVERAWRSLYSSWDIVVSACVRVCMCALDPTYPACRLQEKVVHRSEIELSWVVDLGHRNISALRRTSRAVKTSMGKPR